MCSANIALTRQEFALRGKGDAIALHDFGVDVPVFADISRDGFLTLALAKVWDDGSKQGCCGEEEGNDCCAKRKHGKG